jgi:hypothetical protein
MVNRAARLWQDVRPRSHPISDLSSSFTVEPLEPRFLLSADILPYSDEETLPTVPDPVVTVVENADYDLRVSADGWGNDDDSPLPQETTQAIFDAAISRLATVGFSTEQLAAVSSIPVDVEDLPGWQLAVSDSGRITIDHNAAGYGWFLDETPNDENEFIDQNGELKAVTGSDADGRIDLLTVLTNWDTISESRTATAAIRRLHSCSSASGRACVGHQNPTAFSISLSRRSRWPMRHPMFRVSN